MKKITIIWVLLVVTVSSCKDFLDVKPTNSGDSKTSIRTAADAQVIMNGIMSDITSSNYYGRNFIMYGDAKGGDLTIASQGRGLDPLYTFNHSKTSNSYSGFWTVAYDGIMQVNTLLEAIDGLEAAGTTEDFSTYKGQALTARALMYFDLVRLYGKTYTDDKSSFGVPNVTTTLDPSAQPLRASVAENYTQILSDLTEAAPLLPKARTGGFLNYYANKSIQARVYLTMADYPNALAAAKDVIENSDYKLYANDEWVASWAKEFGDESIFELGIYPNEADLTTSSLGFYLMKLGEEKGASGWFMASDFYLDRLGADEDDVRWGVMAQDESDDPHLGSCYKYSGGVNKPGDKQSSNHTAVNIKVIRLSEVYLIAAEAALNSDKTAAAGYLNAIRKRAPNLAPATAGNITLDMILDEKSKELFAEGQRYFDMIRLNKTIDYDDDFGGIAVSTRPTSIDRSFEKSILPISQAEINANPGIEAQQNPGY